jgi:hypothetical protein
MDADRLSVRSGWIYDDESLICDKIWGIVCCFLQNKREEKQEMREGGRRL